MTGRVTNSPATTSKRSGDKVRPWGKNAIGRTYFTIAEPRKERATTLSVKAIATCSDEKAGVGMKFRKCNGKKQRDSREI